MKDFDFDKELRELSQLKKNKTQEAKPQKGMKTPVIIAALIVLIAVGLFLRPTEETKDPSIKQDVETAQQGVAPDAASKDTATAIGQTGMSSNDKKEGIIKTLRLRPTNPTILDPIKAEVELTDTVPKDRITLKYQWFTNNTHPLEDIEGDTLPAGKVKRGSYVNVRVTEIRDGEVIAQKSSDMVMVQNSAPSLSMRILNSRIKKGDVIEIQLSATDHDGDRLTFALDEAPSGMSIDTSTGRIVYKPDLVGQGVVKFRASVTDSEGAKTSGNFEVNFSIQ